jgi:hypothetical protein
VLILNFNDDLSRVSEAVASCSPSPVKSGLSGELAMRND